MAKSEWFFNDGENNKDIDNGSEKLEKKRTKIEQEIEGWKDLLNTGEITKEMYDDAIEELEEKLQKHNK